MCIDIRPWMCINIIAMKYAILRKYELVIKMSYSSPNTWKNKLLAKKHHIDNKTIHRRPLENSEFTQRNDLKSRFQLV